MKRIILSSIAIALTAVAAAALIVPGITDLTLTSTPSGENLTTDDLVVSYTLGGDATTAATTWYRNGTPHAALVMPFEGGATNALADMSGNGATATTEGTPTWSATGGHNATGAYQFNQNTDGIFVPDAAVFDVDHVTLAAWVYLDSLRDDARIISKEFGTTEPYSIYTMSIGTPGENIGAEDHLEMRIGLEGQNRIRQQSVAAIPTNTWTHIATSCDGATMRLYINGALDSSFPAVGVLRKNNEPVYIGQSGFYDRAPQGWIDDARVYGYALSDAQVMALATQGPTVIKSAETSDSQQWHARVTPFSSTEMGATSVTDTVTIGGVTPTPLVRIMPLGNSITYDNYSGDPRPSSLRTGYRQPLWRMLVSSCYNVDFVGSVVAGESAIPDFDPDNEGHPGWTDSQIRDNIYGWLDSTPADVILLHIGTNGLTSSEAEVMQILDNIDDWEADNNQHITVLLARIINRMSYSSTTTAFNDNVEAAALDRVNNAGNPAYPDDIIMVDLEDGAGIDYSADMVDNLHPNDRGYQKMAAEWYEHLVTVLPGPNPACSGCPDAITHHWPMDESLLSPYTVTQHPDDVRASNGECTNCPIDAAGTVGGAQSFDGADEINVEDDDAFDWAADASFTIEYWMKTAASVSGNRVIIGRDDAASSMHWWTGADNNGTVRFQLRDVNGNGLYLGGTGPVLNDDTWHHVVCVRDEATDSNKVYVDASLVGAGVHNYTANFASDKDINIGWLNLSGGYRYEGLIDEIALYGRALSYTEIAAHYSNGLSGIGVCDITPLPFAPSITSTPVTTGDVGIPYSYDVNASGSPAPTYSLTTSPAGMSIDANTGVIAWIPAPAQEGPNSVTVQATNSEGSDTQDFTVTVGAQVPDLRVMPLGDSITRGAYGDPNDVGYRRPLYLQLQAAACNVDFVGQLTDGSPADFDRSHEGRDGERDDEVAANVYNYLDLNPADVILLHIGTNALDTDTSDVENILDEIDRWEADNSAEVNVLLARIINRNPYSSTTTTFNDNIEAMVNNRTSNPLDDAYPDNIVVVDMEDGAGIVYTTDMDDSVHPNPAGYTKMANLWFTYIDSLFCGVNANDVMLTSTSGNDLDTDDLTVGYNLSAEATTAAVAWYEAATPTMAFYLPMEGGATHALEDVSGNSIVATTFGTPTWNATAGHDGHGAFVFDGSQGLNGGENFPTLSSYTKAAWVYRTGSGANGGNNVISGDENSGGHALWASDSYGNRLTGGHNQNWNLVEDTEVLSLNTWHHVALSYDATTYVMKLYRDGAVVDTAIAAPADRDVTDPTISVGTFGSNGYRWDGTIDDARVYNRVLSPAQIALLATGNIDKIMNTETTLGDQWMAEVIPFSDSDVGEARQSNTVTIQPSAPTAPVIVSIPDTTATVDSPYSYDVNASGSPAPTYSLTTFPTGMTIDANTGVISWTPTTGQEGSNPVTVVATNSEGSDPQSFTVTVSGLTPDLRIMPLGDSITRGAAGDPNDVGYRRPLYLQLQAAGCNVAFAGQLADGSPDDFDRHHEGRDGERDDEVAANVYGYLDLNPADVVLLHIGTNALDTDTSDVESILDEIDRWEADNGAVVNVLLARIINRNPYSSTTTTFNDNIEAMANNRISNPLDDAYPDNITVVDMEDGAGIVYSTDMADLLHPNPTGYTKMANLWFTYIDSLFCGVNAGNVALTSTSGNDLDTDDLTVSYSLSSEATTAAVAWYEAAAPTMVFYLPMEGGATHALEDVSGNSIVATTYGSPTWNATAGHDGHGAFVFDGNQGLNGGENFPAGSSYTKSAWVYRTGSGANGGNNVITGDVNSGGHALWASDTYGNRLTGGHNQNWNIVEDAVVLSLNEWHHVALSYDAATYVMKLYRDGAVVDTAIVGSADRNVTDQTLCVGTFGAGGHRWEGIIDDARVYDRVLSPAQIALLATGNIDKIMNTETSVGDQWMAEVIPFSDSDVGEARQSNTITIQPSAPTAPVIVSIPDTTATAGGLYQYDVDASGSPVPTYSLTTFPAGMTVNGTTGLISWTPAAAGTVSVQVSATNSQGSDSQSFAIVVDTYSGPTIADLALTSTSGNDLSSDDLMVSFSLAGSATSSATAWYASNSPPAPLMSLYLPMEGGTAGSLEDYSGNGITAVTHGDPVWSATSGHDGGGAWTFDGAGDDLSAGENFPTGSSYTKTAWVYRTGSGANGGNNIISGDENGGGHALWAPDGYSNKLSGGHNGHWNLVQDDVALTLNTWFFVALSYDVVTHEMRLYKNGVVIDSAAVASGDQSVTDATISIGSFGASNGWMWVGTIDDARIWNRVLSDAQIASLYTSDHVIKSAETSLGDQWLAKVTAFSATEAGLTAVTDTITIVDLTAPVITSVPDSTARVSELYSQDIDATGTPAPNYSLSVFPAGMTIDAGSGLIEWTPAAEGTVQVQVKATNTAGADSLAWAIVITAPPGLGAMTIASTSGDARDNDTLSVDYTLHGEATTAATSWYVGNSPMTPLMSLYLPFEGGATNALLDYSGNGGAAAIPTNDPVWGAATGHDGHGAFTFDGDDDLAAGEAFPAGGSYTKTAWVYRTGSGTGGGNAIICGNDYAGGHGFWVPDFAGTRLSAGHDFNWTAVQDDTALPLDTWVFVALSYDAGSASMKLYRDGAVVDSATVANAVTDSTVSVGSFGAANGQNWLGTIDDARVYTRALSPQQVAALFAGGTDMIVPEETSVNETWMAEVTPFSAFEAGATARSDTVTIIDVASGAAAAVPTRAELYQNVPNPFNPTTTIEFFVPDAARVSLVIYDVRGRRVVTLVNRTVPDGIHRVVWDGINAAGEQVSTGVYFYRLVAGREVRTRKMVLVK